MWVLGLGIWDLGFFFCNVFECDGIVSWIEIIII